MADLSISNGEYRINSGSWTNSSGEIDNGDTLQVRGTSSTDFLTEVNTIVTVGDYSTNFSITTKDEFPEPLVASLTAYADDPQTSTNKYGFTLSIPEAITGGISLVINCVYDGGSYGTTIVLNSGSTTINTGLVITNGTLGGNITSLLITSDTPSEGTTVTTAAGGETRTLQYSITF